MLDMMLVWSFEVLRLSWLLFRCTVLVALLGLGSSFTSKKSKFLLFGKEMKSSALAKSSLCYMAKFSSVVLGARLV